MKKNFTFLFSLFLLFGAVNTVKADESEDVYQASWVDVTAENVANADLASADKWTSVGGGYAHDAGARVAEFYAGWATLANTSGSLMQEVTLPAGEYRLTGKAFYRAGIAFDTNRDKSLGYMVAGENKVAVKTLGSVEGLSAYANSIGEASTAFYTNDLYTNVLEFTLAEGATLKLGYECTHDEAYSWFIVGQVKLERNVTPAAKFLDQYDAFELLQAQYTSLYALSAVMARWAEVQEAAYALKEAMEKGETVTKSQLEASMEQMIAMTAEIKAIDEYYNNVFTPMNDLCYEIQEKSKPASAEVAAAFEEACAKAGFANLYTNVSTLADLEAIVAVLEAGRRAYVVNAVPAEGYTFDYTFLIEGAGDSADGWVKEIEGFSGNFVYKNSAEKNTADLKKTGFIEAWNPSAYSGTITYTANELPNGYYTVSAYAFTNGETSFFANDKSVVVERTEMYVQPAIDSVLVVDGTLKLGLNVANANWVGITNVELAFIAPYDATGVENLEAVENKSVVIYDLTGRRVEKMQKGIYIVSGKKVYVK